MSCEVCSGLLPLVSDLLQGFMCVCAQVSCSVVSNWPLCEFCGCVYCDILSIFLIPQFCLFLRHQTMDKVQKYNSFNTNTPSSESYRNHEQEAVLEICVVLKLRAAVRVTCAMNWQTNIVCTLMLCCLLSWQGAVHVWYTSSQGME
jgi:hypothetical protein